MLAQNFKTAADLGISDVELESLIKVLGMFERHEAPEDLFTMRDVGAPACGTPGCILGWARTIAGKEAFKALCADYCGTRFTHPVQALFLPKGYETMEADTHAAASALRNYLTLGEPRWAEVLAAH